MTGDANHPSVLVSNRQELQVDEDALVALAREVLLAEGLGDAELSVSFVTDDEIADLRARYMVEEGPTDVLSFAQEDDGERPRLLGDVVIAPAYAARNANGDVASELRLLLVHGVLHLLGYDHEGDDERAAMWVRQERYSGVRVS